MFLAQRFPAAVAATSKFIHDASVAQWKVRQIQFVLQVLESSEKVIRRSYAQLPATSQKYAYMKGQADAHKQMAGLIRDRLSGKGWVDILRAGKR
jgi:hypothetical protein